MVFSGELIAQIHDVAGLRRGAPVWIYGTEVGYVKNKGRGLLGSFVRDEELTKELKDTILQLKELLKNIQDHPRKYSKFSLF